MHDLKIIIALNAPDSTIKSVEVEGPPITGIDISAPDKPEPELCSPQDILCGAKLRYIDGEYLTFLRTDGTRAILSAREAESFDITITGKKKPA